MNLLWIPSGQFLVNPDESGLFTDSGHGMCDMTELAELLTAGNDELLNRPAMGLRKKADTIRTAYAAIDAHLQKPTSLLNTELFARRLAPLADALTFLADVDQKIADRPQDAQGINAACMGNMKQVSI